MLLLLLLLLLDQTLLLERPSRPPVPRSNSTGQHLGRLLQLGWSGTSHSSDILLAPSFTLGSLTSLLPQTPAWWEDRHAGATPDGVPLGESESQEDEDTTPLYRDLG